MTNAKEFSFVDDVANARSDLEGLATYDTNKDGRISAGDTRFGDFHLWRDGNEDGHAAAGEISTLAASGIAALGLAGSPPASPARGQRGYDNSAASQGDGSTGASPTRLYLLLQPARPDQA